MYHSNWDNCTDYHRNELVFENRNKNYGAYIIRRDYSKNMLVSFITACMFMSSALLPYFFKNLHNLPKMNSEKISEVINMETFTPPPLELTPPPVNAPAPASNSKDLANISIVEDRLSQDDIVSNSSTASQVSISSNGSAVSSTSVTGISVPVIPDIIPDNTVKKWAEVMPEFQGGDEKLMSYLSSHIRYPKKALSNNISGTVYLSFVVDTGGMIKNVQLIRGLNEECDLEAIKAVESMPKWIPGSQNGNKVSVEMSLPVRFIIK